LAEAIGVRHMAMLGRFRRRMAAAALAALINAGQLAAGALDPNAVVQLASLMRNVLAEAPKFAADVEHLDSMDFAGELGSDHVLAARVRLSKCALYAHTYTRARVSFCVVFVFCCCC
jgi:hypothetical protein